MSNSNVGPDLSRPPPIYRPVHGALDYGELERLGLHPWEVLDFSVNANPYGPSPRVREAIANVAIDRYPDRECLELRRAILKYELASTNLPLNSIVCGNGTTELIWAIARAYLKPRRSPPIYRGEFLYRARAAILGPTFGEYRVASLAAGASVVEFQVQADAYFQPDIGAIAAWIGREQPSLVWLCNPNNPTGVWLDRQQMLELAEACQRTGAMLVVDEAYWRFVFPSEEYSMVELVGATCSWVGADEVTTRHGPLPVPQTGNPTTPSLTGRFLEHGDNRDNRDNGDKCPQRRQVSLTETSVVPSLHSADLVKVHNRALCQVIVLRSLTKDFALAGLRLGYAVAAPDVAELLSTQLPSWNVNGMAQAAGVAALSDRTHLTTTLDKLAVERHAFFDALRHLGLNVIPSRTHFCLVEVGDAHQIRQQLLNRKILVRDCTSFGLPRFIRVATRPRSSGSVGARVDGRWMGGPLWSPVGGVVPLDANGAELASALARFGGDT